MESRQWIIEKPEQMVRLTAYLARLPIDKPKHVTVCDYQPQRSPQANARYWALTTEAAKHIGCGADELHEEMLCQHFGATEIRMPTGHIRRVPLKRSSTRNVKEFSAYMEFCEAFYATELGVIA